MEAKPYKIPHPFRKLNKKLIDKVVKKIGEGSTKKLACLSNGITTRIFDMWRNQGEVDLEHEVDSLCAYLVLTLSEVQQEEVIGCRKLIIHSPKGHAGAQWTLEHAYQKDFSANAGIRELAEDIEEFKSSFKRGAKEDDEVNSKETK